MTRFSRLNDRFSKEFFMRLNSLFVVLVLCLFSAPVLAGPGHEHGHSHGPASKEQAIKIASKVVKNLAKKKVVDSSWSNIKASGAEKKTFSQGPEWVVTFNNKAIKDSSKQTLYIFLTIEGKYLAANYTGQ
jgi:hypothetical protein